MTKCNEEIEATFRKLYYTEEEISQYYKESIETLQDFSSYPDDIILKCFDK